MAYVTVWGRCIDMSIAQTWVVGDYEAGEDQAGIDDGLNFPVKLWDPTTAESQKGCITASGEVPEKGVSDSSVLI